MVSKQTDSKQKTQLTYRSRSASSSASSAASSAAGSRCHGRGRRSRGRGLLRGMVSTVGSCLIDPDASFTYSGSSRRATSSTRTKLLSKGNDGRGIGTASLSSAISNSVLEIRLAAETRKVLSRWAVQGRGLADHVGDAGDLTNRTVSVNPFIATRSFPSTATP